MCIRDRAGGSVRIPVTIAVDVNGRVRDQEVKRDLEALRFGRNSYARINGKIESAIRNQKSEPIDVEVSLRFGGKADAATNSGKIRTSSFQSTDWNNYRGDPAVNNSTEVTWSEKIDAGKTLSTSVDYHFFTRH